MQVLCRAMLRTTDLVRRCAQHQQLGGDAISRAGDSHHLDGCADEEGLAQDLWHTAGLSVHYIVTGSVSTVAELRSADAGPAPHTIVHAGPTHLPWLWPAWLLLAVV